MSDWVGVDQDELDYMDLFGRYLKTLVGMPSPILLDVGYNEGRFTKAFLSKYSHAFIHAFEPLTEYCGEAARYLQNVGVVHELAVTGEFTHTVDFYVMHDELSGMSSIHYRKDHFAGAEKRRVKCRQLDAIFMERLFAKVPGFTEPCYLKIDTEGHEYSVLQGTHRLIETNTIDFIQYEYGGCYKDANVRGSDIIKFLKGYGYVIVGPDCQELTNWVEDYELRNILAIRSDIAKELGY